MGREPQMTMPVVLILGAMLQRPDEEWYGLALSEYADLKSGTIYPALLRLEEAGWLESRWEDVDPSEVKRPRRRLYRLTAAGQIVARDALETYRRKLGMAGGSAPIRSPGARTA